MPHWSLGNLFICSNCELWLFHLAFGCMWKCGGCFLAEEEAEAEEEGVIPPGYFSQFIFSSGFIFQRG